MTRPGIPAEIKRRTRQRCGFGCVVCGIPIYHYDHIENFAQTTSHDEANLTLLCPTHHTEKTNALIDAKLIREFNRAPFNNRADATTAHALHYKGSSFEAVIGGNTIRATLSRNHHQITCLSIDQIPILSFEIDQENILLNMMAFDRFNAPAMRIEKNELVVSTSTWDVTMVGRTLTLREAPRHLLLEIEFQPPSRVTITRGRILCNGVELLIRPTSICLANSGATITGMIVDDSFMPGLLFGHHGAIPSIMGVDKIPRYPADSNATKAWAREFGLT